MTIVFFWPYESETIPKIIDPSIAVDWTVRKNNKTSKSVNPIVVLA